MPHETTTDPLAPDRCLAPAERARGRLRAAGRAARERRAAQTHARSGADAHRSSRAAHRDTAAEHRNRTAQNCNRAAQRDTAEHCNCAAYRAAAQHRDTAAQHCNAAANDHYSGLGAALAPGRSLCISLLGGHYARRDQRDRRTPPAHCTPTSCEPGLEHYRWDTSKHSLGLDQWPEWWITPLSPGGQRPSDRDLSLSNDANHVGCAHQPLWTTKLYPSIVCGYLLAGARVQHLRNLDGNWASRIRGQAHD